jgi:hypothetical protein
MARWSTAEPLCPQATGLPPAFEVFVTERIREVAGRVGAPLQAIVPCKPNMVVFFTAHPQELLDAIEYDLAGDDQAKMRSAILADQKRFGISDRDICDKAKISHHTMSQLRRRRMLPSKALMAIAEALEFLKATRAVEDSKQAEGYELLLRKRGELSSDARLASFLDIERSHATKLLAKQRRLTDHLITRLRG